MKRSPKHVTLAIKYLNAALRELEHDEKLGGGVFTLDGHEGKFHIRRAIEWCEERRVNVKTGD